MCWIEYQVQTLEDALVSDTNLAFLSTTTSFSASVELVLSGVAVLEAEEDTQLLESAVVEALGLNSVQGEMVKNISVTINQQVVIAEMTPTPGKFWPVYLPTSVRARV